MADDRVIIFDTTLRDGEQSAGIGLTTQEKLEIAKQLERLGVDVIEAGFAASSPGDFEAVSEISAQVRGPKIASLARCVPDDVDSAWEAIKGAERPRIHVFISSSDVQIMHQLRSNPEKVLETAVACVEQAKRYCDDVEFSPMDATRTDIEYLYELLEATIEAGANTVNIPDCFFQHWKKHSHHLDLIGLHDDINKIVKHDSGVYIAFANQVDHRSVRLM